MSVKCTTCRISTNCIICGALHGQLLAYLAVIALISVGIPLLLPFNSTNTTKDSLQSNNETIKINIQNQMFEFVIQLMYQTDTQYSNQFSNRLTLYSPYISFLETFLSFVTPSSKRQLNSNL